ncbi:hypothetical protein [Pseudoramibacter faecis]|uniref:hypothetical protein n=1 Tax=Pseudoramibacter faecis TaxID=3108534 RepID=UPI002E79740D|nr:hypothetical protein [Pseudoramibacter sp. HA2172]
MLLHQLALGLGAGGHGRGVHEQAMAAEIFGRGGRDGVAAGLVGGVAPAVRTGEDLMVVFA